MWWMNEILKSLFVKAVFTSSTLEWVPSAIQVKWVILYQMQMKNLNVTLIQ